MLQVVQRVLRRHLLGRAGPNAGPRADAGRGGAVTQIQRFWSAANLNVYLHCLVLDGMYRRDRDGVRTFVEMGQTYLAESDADGDEARTLRPLQAAAITYRIAFGPRAGHKVLTLRGAMPRESGPQQPLCADIDAFSLHAAVRCEAQRPQAAGCFAAPSFALPSTGIAPLNDSFGGPNRSA